MKINTNSNVYTIIYASVIVVIVAFLLAFVSSVLKPAQDANVAIDKRSQILAALNVRGMDKADITAKYEELIQNTCVLTSDGQVIDGLDAFEVETKEIGEKLPVYQAKTADGSDALVLPLKGRGLWGGLWGYIAVTPDLQRVLGAYFDHESETAGLGALIKDAKFQEQFIGKPVMGADGNVALTVVKKGSTENENQVDGVTGATLTSKGVGEMLLTCIQQYVNAIQGSQVAGLAQLSAGGCQKGHDCGHCAEAQKCCDKPTCDCAQKKQCACKDGSCGDEACNCASDDKCCKRKECPCSCCEKTAACPKAKSCEKPDCCQEAGGCGQCCKDRKCDKCGSCGSEGCCKEGKSCCKEGKPCCKEAKPCCKKDGKDATKPCCKKH